MGQALRKDPGLPVRLRHTDPGRAARPGAGCAAHSLPRSRTPPPRPSAPYACYAASWPRGCSPSRHEIRRPARPCPPCWRRCRPRAQRPGRLTVCSSRLAAQAPSERRWYQHTTDGQTAGVLLTALVASPNPFQDSPAGALARARRPAQPAPPPGAGSAHSPASPPSSRPRCSAACSPHAARRRSVDPAMGDAVQRRIPTAAADVGAEQRTTSAAPRNVRRKRGTAGHGHPVEPGKRDRTSPAAGAPRGTPAGHRRTVRRAGPPRAVTSTVPAGDVVVRCTSRCMSRCKFCCGCRDGGDGSHALVCNAFSSLARPVVGEDGVRRWPPGTVWPAHDRQATPTWENSVEPWTKPARWTSPAPGRLTGQGRAPPGRE